VTAYFHFTIIETMTQYSYFHLFFIQCSCKSVMIVVAILFYTEYSGVQMLNGCRILMHFCGCQFF